MQIRFAQSARRHRIGRARVLHVLANARAVATGPPPTDSPAADLRILIVGDDATGRPLEVVAVIVDDDLLLVIHAMDLRDKYRDLYEGDSR
jgi:hypothetical protein